MNCPNCSKEISETAKVCGYCGTRLTAPVDPGAVPAPDTAIMPASGPASEHEVVAESRPELAPTSKGEPAQAPAPAPVVVATAVRPARAVVAAWLAILGSAAAALSVFAIWSPGHSLWEVTDVVWGCARASAEQCSYWEVVFSPNFVVGGGYLGIAAIWSASVACALAASLLLRPSRRAASAPRRLAIGSAVVLMAVGIYDAVQFYRLEIESPGTYGVPRGPTILAGAALVTALSLLLTVAWSRSEDR